MILRRDARDFITTPNSHRVLNWPLGKAAEVLNVTSFLSEHPGGELAILTFAGKDATEEFNMLPGCGTDLGTQAPNPLALGSGFNPECLRGRRFKREGDIMTRTDRRVVGALSRDFPNPEPSTFRLWGLGFRV